MFLALSGFSLFFKAPAERPVSGKSASHPGLSARQGEGDRRPGEGRFAERSFVSPLLGWRMFLVLIHRNAAHPALENPSLRGALLLAIPEAPSHFGDHGAEKRPEIITHERPSSSPKTFVQCQDLGLGQASDSPQAQGRFAQFARLDEIHLELRDPIVVFLRIHQHLLHPP